MHASFPMDFPLCVPVSWSQKKTKTEKNKQGNFVLSKHITQNMSRKKSWKSKNENVVNVVHIADNQYCGISFILTGMTLLSASLSFISTFPRWRIAAKTWNNPIWLDSLIPAEEKHTDSDYWCVLSPIYYAHPWPVLISLNHPQIQRAWYPHSDIIQCSHVSSL